MRRCLILILISGMIFPEISYACTSAIIPGWATSDGRPLLWKHRDTGNLDNRLEHFKGEKYNFIGLVNSLQGSRGNEVWIGCNTAGFSIMNTASYCLKNDSVPDEYMDMEGVLMYRALEICASLSDFEHYLDTLSRPMGVEANFGCIDAFGGAAYYETWNDGYVKRNVDEFPEGYCVVTNFSIHGRKDDWKGYERFVTASDIIERQVKIENRFTDLSPLVIMDSLSRSYEHKILGINLADKSDSFLSGTSGIAVDQDFIPRRSTSASVVIHGVRKGESADKTVIWTALGYPSCAVMIPVPLSAEDTIPECMKKSVGSVNCQACDLSLYIKDSYIFNLHRMSNGYSYMNMRHILKGEMGRPSLLECSRKAERNISDQFSVLYDRYINGNIGYDGYIEGYKLISKDFMRIIENSFVAYQK
ncbi:MAG: hypothetical protein E7117_04705 [Bacteroidales bacterium]|nr:hypothetical protein [Bacteroidales bacterium]